MQTLLKDWKKIMLLYSMIIDNVNWNAKKTNKKKRSNTVFWISPLIEFQTLSQKTEFIVKLQAFTIKSGLELSYGRPLSWFWAVWKYNWHDIDILFSVICSTFFQIHEDLQSVFRLTWYDCAPFSNGVWTGYIYIQV